MVSLKASGHLELGCSMSRCKWRKEAICVARLSHCCTEYSISFKV